MVKSNVQAAKPASKPASKPAAKPAIVQQVIEEIIEETEDGRDSCIDGLDARIEEITIVKAHAYLAVNLTNRPMKPKRWQRYMQQMLDGIWADHLPFTIVLDANGGNHNSQHTLKAFTVAHDKVMTARKTNPKAYPDFKETLAACIISGIDENDADYLDIGDARVAGDVLFRLHLFEAGYKDAVMAVHTWKDGQKAMLAKWLGTALKIVYNRLYMRKKVRTATKFEQGTMLNTLSWHPNLVDSCVEVWCANQLGGKPGKGIASKISLPYMVALHYLAWHSELEEQDDGTFVGTRRELANAFVRNIATGESTGQGNVLHELREYLISMKVSTKKGNTGLDETYDACIQAWNYFVVHGEKKTFKAKNLIVSQAKQSKDDGGGYLEFPEMGGMDVYTQLTGNATVDEETEE